MAATMIDRAEFIAECESLRPALRQEHPFEIVCSVIAVRDLLLTCQSKSLLRRDLFDVLAELIPEQREFWLRCEATDHERFIGGMTSLFTEKG